MPSMNVEGAIAVMAYLESFVTPERRATIAAVLAQRTRYLTVVAEDFHNSHNAGALLRTYERLGIQDVHVGENFHPFKARVGAASGSSKWVTRHHYGEGERNNTLACCAKLRSQAGGNQSLCAGVAPRNATSNANIHCPCIAMTDPSAEQLIIESRAAWRAWLQTNHSRQSGLWVVTYKKHCGDRYVAYDEIVEEALCFGWIDSLPRKLDSDRTMLWLAPRQPGSGWSKLNKTRIEKMMAAGLMTAAGWEKIKVAQQDGSWSALDAIENLEIPADLAAAFADVPPAERHFAAFPKSVKRGILEWIASAKKAETRAKRVQETATLAQQNIRANQWRRKDSDRPTPS